MRRYLLLLAVLCFVGCESVLYSHREGELRPDGRIEPCHESRVDLQACGNAIFNAPLLPKIELGMTTEAVRELMKHEAERRDVRLEGDRKIEVWKYMQDYDRELMSAITFTDGKVTSVTTVSWEE
ncbi:MAG: hypothetical protein ABI779_06545 [Acidobacteriota bacterium]